MLLWGGLGLVLAAVLAFCVVKLDWTSSSGTAVAGKGGVAGQGFRTEETRTGQLVFFLGNSERCRRLLFDNDNGMMQDLGLGPCEASAPEVIFTPAPANAAAGSTSRLGGIREGFKR
jgi:hypothetical protein